jgi:4-amino-4-deoxy-L-arabinose transferase-like glycosyltransferase
LPAVRTLSPPRLAWLTLALVVLGAATVRYRLADVPLERDEGEYAYAGQLILEGLAPYQHVYNRKLPGIYAAYAVILATFGRTARAVHLALLCVNALTIVLLYVAGTRLADRWAGITAAAAFALTSLGRPVLGLFANAEHFVVLFVAAALPLLLRAQDARAAGARAAAGLLLGIAILMKQHGAAFAALGGIWLALGEPGALRRPGRLVRRLAPFAAGVVVPYAATCLVLASAGALDEFWYWTVGYARRYATQVPLWQGWDLFYHGTSHLLTAAPALWALAGCGVVAAVLDPVARRRAGFLATLSIAAVASIIPGLFFRPHYFLLVLPAGALLAGVAVSTLARRIPARVHPALRAGLPALVLLGAVGSALWADREYLLRSSPYEVARASYGGNPFPESVEIGRFLRERSAAGDRIAVFGSEPQIYFYAGRRAATGYIYMYPMMEAHDLAPRMQDEMILEVAAAAPRFMVFVRIGSSWLRQRGSHDRLVEWYREYSDRYYRRVGLVEITEEATAYDWGPQVHWPPSSPLWVEVVERKK